MSLLSTRYLVPGLRQEADLAVTGYTGAEGAGVPGLTATPLVAPCGLRQEADLPPIFLVIPKLTLTFVNQKIYFLEEKN